MDMLELAQDLKGDTITMDVHTKLDLVSVLEKLSDLPGDLRVRDFADFWTVKTELDNEVKLTVFCRKDS